MSDYLQWKSNVSLEKVFSSAESFSYPVYFGRHIIYLTTLKKEKSRVALMLKSDSGTHCITPQPYSLRTKVNEYGGKSFWLVGDQLFFTNQSDQCLYRQQLTESEGLVSVSEPVRITPKPVDDCIYMFTDVNLVSDKVVFAIVEQSNPLDSNVENNCFITKIDFSDSVEIIAPAEQGASFYSNLVYEPSSKSIAWVQWSHPSMPWDANDVFVAKLDGRSFSVKEKNKVPLKKTSSVCQLCFASNGNLFLSADFSTELEVKDSSDFWNVYCYKLTTNELIQVTNESLEFGYPHWQYGDSRIVQLDDSNLLTIASAPEGDQLFLISQNNLEVSVLSKTQSTIQALSSDESGRALMIEFPKEAEAKLIEFMDREFVDITKQVLNQIEGGQEAVSFDKKNVSIAHHFNFDCRDGEQAYGFYYPPCNESYDLSDNAPPLIVMVHGGPTARAYGHYDIQKQFWTSRGFALFDVNHRGSSGYGRRYRDALYGQWGEVDCADIIDGINALVQDGKADHERVCIRGKSAGGYAVLRALTEYPEVFRAGACYYGIGNLATLAKTTHKFEKHYADRLVGEQYSQDTSELLSSRFYQRSPIHKIDQLKSAMIVFQGTLDNVVPPEVAHEVVSVLKRLNLDHEYVEYSDEAHGFRQVANNVDAWSKELAFYRRVLN